MYENIIYQNIYILLMYKKIKKITLLNKDSIESFCNY